MTRLPAPDWGREGETWQVEPEDAVPWRTDVNALYCRVGECRERAIAGYSTRSGDFNPRCEIHLREQRMWIEDGRVVSWRLGPVRSTLDRDWFQNVRVFELDDGTGWRAVDDEEGLLGDAKTPEAAIAALFTALEEAHFCGDPG